MEGGFLVEFLDSCFSTYFYILFPNLIYFPSGSDEDNSELSQNLPPTPQKEGEKEGDDGELKKQEMLVQYLKDTETFALQVERAISVINTMLYWKTTSGRRQYSPECKPLQNVFSIFTCNN